ncbi:hypothetical protein BEP19_13420 [Ammoniphilus oxalaticus]|uniref:SH3b domain-containing protein n=1 Tax=Ammoniphilus oxalaticus TaxID=66863 RepID=A0A419SF20_9BACL|nr:SpoIID/LytB domain-containing protein [Ammoniphilus oxalaticus]RKD22067.1 hypothetical protein BEP19_13420 [Ammoniphilus oxalaticus]
MSVKLVRTVGNQASLAVDVMGSFQVEETQQALPAAQALRIQADQNQLALYQGDQAIYRGSTITVTPHTYGLNQVIKINGKPYLGQMTFSLENGSIIRPINTLPIEDYLKGVVPNEMPASWELEALKAQSIAARTYAVRRAGQLIDDTVNYQVYNGFQWNERTSRAVDETKGQVLMHNGALIDALYSSSNGGMIEASGSLWHPNAYLPAKADPFDPQNPWSLSFKKVQLPLEGRDLQQADAWWNQVQETDPAISNTLRTWLQQNGYAQQAIKIVEITNLSFSGERTAGNRISKGQLGLTFIVKQADGSAQFMQRDFSDVPANAFRQMLGGGTVFKSLFVDSLGQQGDSWTISGKGYGHAVGMSQYGANAMAKQGKSANEITAFYYPGTALTAALPVSPQPTQIAQANHAVTTQTTQPPTAAAPKPTSQLAAAPVTANQANSLASRSAGLSRQGTIKASVLVGLRAQPNFQTQPTQTIKPGEQIEIIGKHDRWYHVKVGEVSGYVADDFVQLR